MSFCFPSFISKAEVQNYPIIGSIAKSIQCLFVTRDKDRRSNNNNPVIYIYIYIIGKPNRREMDKIREYKK